MAGSRSGKTVRFRTWFLLAVTALILGAGLDGQPPAQNHREQVILADPPDPNWNNTTSGVPGPGM
ncbi:hypothetical protein [Actinoplanes sp. NBRC 103695]|uniref:hypothetical protein n=1 Tax=Actinoplanes sp. NBRC 103695 TaxID=3032202 RepID=UPI0024A59E17|nr:hypothetical protein [Actinoplanes sp. NBRC 103695]GLZ01144.1 hypothetical protein Acsp02_83950 [Actinoplanes sp. NBRC 103695]